VDSLNCSSTTLDADAFIKSRMVTLHKSPFAVIPFNRTSGLSPVSSLSVECDYSVSRRGVIVIWKANSILSAMDFDFRDDYQFRVGRREFGSSILAKILDPVMLSAFNAAASAGGKNVQGGMIPLVIIFEFKAIQNLSQSIPQRLDNIPSDGAT